MPRPRFHKLDADTRLAILDAAASEFAQQGYNGASLNRSIARAGISKGAFYYYFDDKADLFATVLERAWQVLEPDRGLDLAALDRDSFWPQLEGLFVATSARARQVPWMVGIARLIYHPPSAAGVDEAVAERFDRFRGWLRAVLERGRELGLVRRDLPADLLLSVLVAAAEAADRWVVEHWEELYPAEIDATGRQLFGLLRSLVVPASEGGV